MTNLRVMPPLVSVIVVNYNRADLLRACLDSVLSQTYARFELLLVDNGSKDESAAAVKARYGDSVRIVRLTENRGFAGGVNAGLEQAQGEFIGLLNNDARAQPDWLSHMMQAFEESPRIGMAACKILLADGVTIDKAGHLLFWDGQNRGRGTGEPDRGQFDSSGRVLFPDGCAAVYRRCLLEEAGGLDEDFFAYADDADLGLRATWLGWTCRYVPQAIVHHHQSATTDVYAPQKVYWVERNRMWLACKNFPLPLLLMSPLFTLYRWLWNVAAAVLGEGASGRFREQQNWRVATSTILRACRDGVAGLPRMWRKRRRLWPRRRISSVRFTRLIWQHRISARELAFGDRPRADSEG